MTLLTRRTAFALLTSFVFTLSLSSYAFTVEKSQELDSRWKDTTQELVHYLSKRHYLRKSIDDDMSVAVFDQWIKSLDPQKLYFLQSDIDSFEPIKKSLDDGLVRGDTSRALVIFNLFKQRSINRTTNVVNQLPELINQLDFSKDDVLEKDRKEAQWPATQQELDNLWHLRLKSEILSLKLSGSANDDIVSRLQKRYKMQLNRLQQLSPDDGVALFFNSVTSVFDPHTSYLSPDDVEQFNIAMSLSLEGIGAVLQQDGEMTKILRLVPGGPAERSGELKPTDKIIGVDEHADGDMLDVIGMPLSDVVKYIRGPKGKKVRLEILQNTDDMSKKRTITIVRDKVKLEEQAAKSHLLELYHNEEVHKVGVIELPTFYTDFAARYRNDKDYRSSTKDVQKLLDELIAQDVEGVVIDLRNNGGGSLLEANELVNLFIGSGPSVQIRDSHNRVMRQGEPPRSSFYQLPMVVLINRLSASASEIFAGAMQDYDRALIVGSQSFGKGTVQAMVPLEMGQLKLTQSKFYRISGDSTQNRGIVPDITFPSLLDDKDVGESALDYALIWDRIAPIQHNDYIDYASIINSLNDKHENRIKIDPDFVFINESKLLRAEQDKIKVIPLNEVKRLEQKQTIESAYLAIENKRRGAKGLDLLTSLEDKKSEEEEAIAEPEKKDIRDDFYLAEAGYILLDSVDMGATMPNLIAPNSLILKKPLKEAYLGR